ncbi:MAG: NADPH dehydrogenase NamA [Tissierellia bacterium]|nr:NADPH dehydrogenase NamA [Tissierellia bacterium]MDD4726366.1 NADPH dehydrogenase NamA [Tissierellia bacterium]
MKSLTEYSLKGLNLKNRIVMPPMCMYSADEEGKANDFHEVHYASRAAGGVGLIIVEATGVTPNGRISSNDLGIWSDEHIEGLKRIVEKVHAYDGKIGIQISHAGRKCQSNDEYIVGPSAISYSDKYRVPRELSKDHIRKTVLQFKDAAKRANDAGFDMIEIHGAHGYLINEFLSPLSNRRNDQYGGSCENRVRFLKEILSEVKEVWPDDKPISLRVSADDYTEGGIDKAEMIKIVNLVKEDIDIVHVSSGGVVSAKIDTFPGYQVTHAETIKKMCNVPTIAVGLIKDYDHIEEIVANGRADLVALGRALLREPYLVLNMAYEKGVDISFPRQYERGFL